MKTKIVEITKTDARIDMLRIDTGTIVLLVLSVILLMQHTIYPQGWEELIYGVIIFLLVLAVSFIGVSSLAKNEIQALNIIGWPFKKYILKEGKDE